MLRALRMLLLLDAAVLFSLGLSFIFTPNVAQKAFSYAGLRSSVDYMIGMWGCVYATMAVGYLAAAMNPIRNVVWIQVGIARGALECLFGIVSIARGSITWSQAGFGILVGGVLALA